MAATPTALHWSGGKDSALALTRLLADPDHTVVCLVTTVHPTRDASSVHGIPVPLLQAQARNLGLPLRTVPLTGAGLDGYAEAIADASRRLLAQGVTAAAFGDLSASGARALKEEQFGPLGVEVVEPLWGLSSSESVEAFLTSGLRAVTVVVDADVLGIEHVGVPLDRAYVDALPAGADPAGELGEYHTFVHDGPIFAEPVPFTLGAPHHLERVIGTTGGPRRFHYWLATPGPAGGA